MIKHAFIALLLNWVLVSSAAADSLTINLRQATESDSAADSTPAQRLHYPQQFRAQRDPVPSQATGELAPRPSNLHFEIFDAWVSTRGDLDGDGFFHHVSINFDADVSIDAYAAVYAKIYLSRNAAPWFLLATTDLFEIYGDDANDRYAIHSELVEGFSPGYYSVLIELHSLYHDRVVSEYRLDFDIDGHVLALEDLYHDEPAYKDPHAHSTSEHYSGAFNGYLLMLLASIAMLRVLRERIVRRAMRPEAEGGINTPVE